MEVRQKVMIQEEDDISAGMRAMHRDKGTSEATLSIAKKRFFREQGRR